MRPYVRPSIASLCLFLVGVLSLPAQPFLNHRITSVRAIDPGQVEVTLQSSQAGAFDSVSVDKEAHFKLRENGKEQTSLKTTALGRPQGVSRTVILADLSRSLTRRQFAEFKNAALDFVSELSSNDLVALVTFQSKVRRELNFTSDKELLRKRIRALKQTGRRTMLYDGLLEAHKMLSDQSVRKAIVVYTDGRENASRIQFADLIDVFTAQSVPLFVAGKHASFALKRLIRLARVSGGDAFRAHNAQDLKKLFHYLGRLRSYEYRLTYQTSQKPGSTLDIEIDAPRQENPLRISYTLPQASEPAQEKNRYSDFFNFSLPKSIGLHMPEILLTLIVLLLVAVIVMLFFRKQEINVKVENSHAPVILSQELPPSFADKKIESRRVKLPFDYHHGWLVEKEGPHTGRKYKINWHNVTLGFSDENSIVIEDNTVSPKHARIERQGSKFVLFDLLSENGTWLNDKKLLRPKELNDFDEIGLGRTRLIFRKGAGVYGENGEIS